MSRASMESATGGGVAMGYTTVRSHMRDGYGV